MSFYSARSQNNYNLYVKAVDKDQSFIADKLGLQTTFRSQTACIEYVNRLPGELRQKGYITASIDSLRFDSTSAKLVLFIGDAYKLVSLKPSGIDPEILESTGWRERDYINKPFDAGRLKEVEEIILDHLENNGYPFGKVYIDSISIENDKVSGLLKIHKGPLYKIDSIRVYGDVNVTKNFIHHYLQIYDGSFYNKTRLQNVSSRLAELPYLEEERSWTLTMLGTGSILNLYLRPKRSSQVNVLVGFLPNNDQLSSKKMLITGEANINLKNALGAGETIGLNWQQLQVKSPRLHLIYQHPYLFNSPVGLDFSFDMFRKDSTFLNVNLQLGVQYMLSASKSGKLFIQRFQTIVNQVNTQYILQFHELPPEADVSAFNLGVDYEYANTDYRFNPRKGNEFRIIGTAGTKKIKENGEILELKDPNDPSFDFGSLYDSMKLNSYQFRVNLIAAKYFPIGNRSTFKTAINGGVFQSENIFRNELFQIGGYKLLRGFDEESQYVSQYVVGTLEYRYLIGRNSFFYAFSDGAWGRNRSQNTDYDHTYFGTGLGMAFETKAGIFNLAVAAGKRDDLPFNLRQTKIHFGFVNYF